MVVKPNIRAPCGSSAPYGEFISYKGTILPSLRVRAVRPSQGGLNCPKAQSQCQCTAWVEPWTLPPSPVPSSHHMAIPPPNTHTQETGREIIHTTILALLNFSSNSLPGTSVSSTKLWLQPEQGIFCLSKSDKYPENTPGEHFLCSCGDRELQQ